MAGKGELVPRPPKKIEYEIRFVTANAKKGWQDLAATIRNPLADAWDFLTRTPHANVPTNYPLKGELGTIRRDGKTHERWGDCGAFSFSMGHAQLLAANHSAGLSWPLNG